MGLTTPNPMKERIVKTKSKEDTTWEEQRLGIIKKQPHLLKVAESCSKFLSGFCCEHLDSGRAFDCLFVRDYKKGTKVSCSWYKEVSHE